MVEQTFDLIPLPSLPVGTDVMLTVVIQATNIGDASLPTTVVAEVVEGSMFAIEILDNDYTSSAITHNTDVISVPRSGNGNTFDASFPLDIISIDLNNVLAFDLTEIEGFIELEFDGSDGEEELFSVAGVTELVSNGSADTEFITEVSTSSSPVTQDPPTTENVFYRIEAITEINGETESAMDTTGRLIALWAGVLENTRRSGILDVGGDDWATAQTYDWVANNLNLLSGFVGDISGEHGKDIDHKTHRDGRDIDFRQYGSVYMGSGRTIFALAEADAITVISGAADALTRLTTFVEDQRTGISNLVANSGVDFLWGPHGEARSGLPSGWLNSLIRDGVIPSTVPATLGNPNPAPLVDIGGGIGNVSTNYINRTQDDHNDHYHVRILQ